MELVFCRMGTKRSTIAAAKSPKSSGFNFTVSSPAAIIIHCVRYAAWKHTKMLCTTSRSVLQASNSMQSYCMRATSHLIRIRHCLVLLMQLPAWHSSVQHGGNNTIKSRGSHLGTSRHCCKQTLSRRAAWRAAGWLHPEPGGLLLRA